MVLKSFSFLDTKTGCFSTPFFMHHIGAAVRASIDLAADLSTNIGRHPADYILCCIGEWDDQNSQFHSEGVVQIGTVLGLMPHQPLLDIAGAENPAFSLRRPNGARPSGDLGGEY